MTHASGERVVKEFESELDALKQAFATHLRAVGAAERAKQHPSVDQLLDAQASATRYFNKAEEFAGRVALLTIAEKGQWVTGFSESCQTVLNSLIAYTSTMTTHSAELGGAYQRPSGGAYANLQRMVAQYLPDDAEDMAKRLRAVGLPTRGFDATASKDRWGSAEKKAAATIAGAFILLLVPLWVALTNPHPSPLLDHVCRTLFALAGALIAGFLPGQLKTKIRAKFMATSGWLRASGALGVFAIIYFFSAGH